MIRDCKVCGTSYKTCFVCERDRSWRLHTDTIEHYHVFTVIMSYQVNHDAKQAYKILREHGVDFHNTAEFRPNIRKVLAEIYALAHESSRAKKAAVAKKVVNTEDTASTETVEQQETEPREG